MREQTQSSAARHIITAQEARQLQEGLKEILADLDSGKLVFDMTCEDIHMFVEQMLTQRLGDVGKKGLPFRTAYKLSGGIVAHCMEKGWVLETMPLAEYQKFSPLFSEDVYSVIDLKVCASSRISVGGTSPESVEQQLRYVRQQLEKPV